MRTNRRPLLKSSLILGVVVLCQNNAASACSVCFGDPNSDMARGVTAGVATLAGVIGFVLLGVLGTGLLWFQRGRRVSVVGDIATRREISA